MAFMRFGVQDRIGNITIEGLSMENQQEQFLYANVTTQAVAKAIYSGPQARSGVSSEFNQTPLILDKNLVWYTRY